MRARTFAVFVLLSVYAAACERCAPGRVGEGVARLTIRNTGAITELINDDTRCGFESAAVKDAVMLTGAGSNGTGTWSVDQCTIDLSEPRVTTDCNGVTTTMRGKLIVSGKRTIHGTLTGDNANAVIPDGPDAVTIELTQVEFENFVVEVSDSDANLTMISGSISATLKPRLAVASDTGICSIASKNVTFEDVSYGSSKVHVIGDGRSFDVDVNASSLHAVSNENLLSGSITVWESKEDVKPEDGLNPDYDAAMFDSAWACTEGLKTPVTFDCSGGVAPRLAQGAARLSIRNFGTFADRLDKDTACGFASAKVLDAATFDVPAGSVGSATFTVENCTLDFGTGTVVATDCEGNQTIVSGKATVSGTKTLRGRVTGDRVEPVVPMSDEPADVSLTLSNFDQFQVEEDGTALTWISGSAHGTIHPRVAADSAKKGACAFETPIARFDFSYDSPAQVKLRSSSGSFTATIDTAHLTALNGNWNAEQNLLSGNITFNGETFAADNEGLDPEYDQAAFDRSWQCGSLEQPVRFDCAFVEPIATGASQLTVQLFGKLAEMLEHDASCGFASTAVQNRVMINGELAKPNGSAVYTANNCTLTFPERTVWKTDCNGKSVYVSGTARVSGTKTLRGYVSGDAAEPIVPTSRDPVEFDLTASFENFAVWSDPETDRLSVGSGTLSGKVRPRLGIDELTGACSIPTPVAELAELRWQDANMRVESEGKIFDVRVASSVLHAINGPRDTFTNRVDGSIKVDGFEVIVNSALDPDYEAATFAASYACIENLRVPAAEAECNMKQTLGEGAARLLVLTLGNLTSMANNDTDCGFDARRVLTNPSQVVGDVGDQGMMRWDISDCTMAPNANEPIKTDCNGRETIASGEVTFTGSRTVTGLRNEVVILIIIRFDSIIPNTRNSVTVDFGSVAFNDFNIIDGDRGLRLRNGTASAQVHPILGERASEPGNFDVPTPIVHLSTLRVQNADARILFGGKRFDVHIDSADLEAFNGSWIGSPLENYIAGTIVIDGQTVNVAPSLLDEEFDQAAFDQTYACTADLRALVENNPAP